MKNLIKSNKNIKDYQIISFRIKQTNKMMTNMLNNLFLLNNKKLENNHLIIDMLQKYKMKN